MKIVTNWRCYLLTPEENKVFEALDDPQWDARTIHGLTKDTGLPVARIMEIVRKYPNLIQVVDTSEYGQLFMLRNRTHPLEDGILDKALDYLSLGRRKRIA